MIISKIYLTTLSLPWRLALSDDINNKVTDSKTICI